MIVVCLIALEAATVAAFFMLTRKHEQRIDTLLRLGQRDRATPNPDIAALIALTENLCQRIQAPEQAVTDHSVSIGPVGVLPIPPLPDDDEGFWASRESKDELAERMMAEELHAA